MRVATLHSPFRGCYFNRSLRFGILCFVLSPLQASAADTAADPKDKVKPLPLETVALETKDGLQMEADYYPSKKGKDAVPVILLHGWKGSRADLAPLALALQGKDLDLGNKQVQPRGFAVIVPDLRGHGGSTKIKIHGDSHSIDQSLLKKSDFEAMATQDMEAVKKFLLEKNNAGELNIEKLCVVGADMGALVAMDWAVRDWNAPPLLNVKQGKDVKALVLISPPMNFRGISVSPALSTSTLQSDLSVLVLVGNQDRKTLDDAQRIHKKIGALRPKPPTDPDEAAKSQDVFFAPVKTNLQGTKILESKELANEVTFDIAQFIELRLVNKKFPWAMRKSAFGE